MLHANQPDTWSHGLSAQAQHVTPHPGALPPWGFLDQRTGAPLEPLCSKLRTS